MNHYKKKDEEKCNPQGLFFLSYSFILRYRDIFCKNANDPNFYTNEEKEKII